MRSWRTDGSIPAARRAHGKNVHQFTNSRTSDQKEKAEEGGAQGKGSIP